MIFSAEEIRMICKKAFMATGASEKEALVVADVLLEANLMGLDSHGFHRIAEYLPHVKRGTIKPGAPIEIQYETDNSVIVNGNWNYGMVTAKTTTDIVIEKAKINNIAIGTTRHCNHIGRLGAYTQKVAEAGLFGIAVVNSSRHGHWVAPFGGAEGRLATNPLSYACPTKGDPIILDMSTSMVAEGKIRVLMQSGKELPDYCVLTSEGKPTNNPKEFYEPTKGTILPFGGTMGYKGFGLGLMVELLGSTLSGVRLTPDGQKDDYINGFFIIAMNPKIFGEDNYIIDYVEEIKDYIVSAKSAEGSKGVIMPGQLDFAIKEKRLKKGVEVAEETWKNIVETGKEFNIDLEEGHK